jgi:hypothetical protein
MTDIVKRLRRNAGGMCISTPAEMEAADTIERLQDELDSWKGLTKQLSAELDALKAGVPNAKNLGDHKSAAYVLGWNECRCAMLTTPKPGDKAAARLIAAAPDLLAVVQELEQSAGYWSEYDVPLGIVDRLRAAIAKATGEQSKGTAAWADVPDATQWLEELRGNTGEPT